MIERNIDAKQNSKLWERQNTVNTNNKRVGNPEKRTVIGNGQCFSGNWNI
jgi:hypothetical protein